MSNCNNINEDLKALEAELEALESLERGLMAQADLADPPKKTRPKVLRTYAGDEVTFDPGEWVTQAEIDAMKMGDQVVRQMVEDGFNNKKKPLGRTGRMVNYSQISPDDDNIATLLEVIGAQRSNTPKGVELKRTFTEQVATKALMAMAQAEGADPRAVGQALAKRVKGIDNLPAAVYGIAKARWDAATQYTDVLDELADAIDGGYINEQIKYEAGNAAKWAHFYEQLDAQVRRQLGRAFKSLQFNKDIDIDLINIRRESSDLTIDQITGSSLVADMLELTAKGDAQGLRKLAAAKRAATLAGGGINDKGFMADLRILNTFRRANLLSSISSWAVRNPVSGALVQGLYMGEDVLGGTFRLMAKNGLKAGTEDGLKAAAYGAKAFNSAWRMAWFNATESLRTGKGTMSEENLKYVSAGLNENAKEFVNSALTTGWDQLTSVKGAINPLNYLNVLNASVWKVFGMAVEMKTGSDAGYLAPFRLLNSGDEYVRTMAYVWKTNHEAFLQAAEEGRKAGKNAEWIEKRADQLSENTIFSGVFSDDDLAEFRRRRNQQYGMPVGDEISNDELRAMLYEQYKNAPNLEGSELGAIGRKRMEDVTFTGSFDNAVLQGTQMMRSNPLVAWEVPFFKVPINGIGWVLNRDILVAGPKYLIKEGKQGLSRLQGKGAKYTVEEMADARARIVVATALAATTHMLWENKLFTDGGSFDPRQRDREKRNHRPYSFSLAGTIVGAAKFQGLGIDAIDLMGLHADVLRAWSEGVIGNNDAGMAVQKIVIAYGQLLKNKAALRNITSILNYAQDPDRYDVAWVLGDQFGGTLPVSGFFGHGVRGFSPADESNRKRRTLSADEMSAMNKDPLLGPLQPVFEMLQSAFVRANASYPGIGMLQPRETDWLGNSIQRPFGLPIDATIPFMPVLMPEDSLYKWLEKHGFGDMPHPDGKINLGDNVELTMLDPEEDFYRDTMRTTVGQLAPEDIGVSAGRLLPIAKYVMGRNLRGALDALRLDPAYDAMINNPGGGISPSLTVQPGKSLSARKDAGGAQLYAPIDDIIDYYDRLAVMKLIGNKQLQFGERFMAVAKQRQLNLREYAQGASTLGVTRH